MERESREQKEFKKIGLVCFYSLKLHFVMLNATIQANELKSFGCDLFLLNARVNNIYKTNEILCDENQQAR